MELPDLIGPIAENGRPQGQAFADRRFRRLDLEEVKEEALRAIDPKDQLHLLNLAENVEDWRAASEELQRTSKSTEERQANDEEEAQILPFRGTLRRKKI